MFSGSKNNFTFMECIAVMVIIVVLTVILLPLTAKCRELAKNIQCKNNIKSITEAILAYTNDRAGVLPSTEQPDVNWLSKIIDNNYIPAPKISTSTAANGYKLYTPMDYKTVLTCPSQPIYWKNQYLADSCDFSSADTNFWWYKSHYSMMNIANAFYKGRIQGKQKTLLPSKIALVRDSRGGVSITWWPCWGKPFNRHMGGPANYTGTNYDDYNIFHGSGVMNTGTLDGAVISLKSTDYSKYSW